MANSQASKTLPLSNEALLKSFQKRLKDDVRSLYDNLTEISKFGISKPEEESTLTKVAQAEQNRYEIEVRAANMSRASESLMKLISEVKQYVILNDFSQINDSIKAQVDYSAKVINKIDVHIMQIRDEMANELNDLEEEYYTSRFK